MDTTVAFVSYIPLRSWYFEFTSFAQHYSEILRNVRTYDGCFVVSLFDKHNVRLARNINNTAKRMYMDYLNISGYFEVLYH